MEHVLIIDDCDLGFKDFGDNHRYRITRKDGYYCKYYKFIFNSDFRFKWSGEVYRITKDYVYIWIY